MPTAPTAFALEERVEVSGTINPNPIKQYIYFPFYIDAVASVLYDPDGAGITRYDYLHDANFNVVAIVTGTTSFNVVERYHTSVPSSIPIHQEYGPQMIASVGAINVAIHAAPCQTGQREDRMCGV